MKALGLESAASAEPLTCSHAALINPFAPGRTVGFRFSVKLNSFLFPLPFAGGDKEESGIQPALNL